MLSFVFLFSDILGSTAFAPVKLDISGNIKVRYVLFWLNLSTFITIILIFLNRKFSISSFVQFQRQYTVQIILELTMCQVVCILYWIFLPFCCRNSKLNMKPIPKRLLRCKISFIKNSKATHVQRKTPQQTHYCGLKGKGPKFTQLIFYSTDTI